MNYIHLFTDFSFNGPYVGELKSVLCRNLKDVTCIDLMHDAPKFNPKASAYLLAALSDQFDAGDSCLAIIDPEVGAINRRPVLVNADNIIYCGPDNGLFSIVIKKAKQVVCYEIINIPETISSSFHGRDLFAPALVDFLTNKNNTREVDPVSLIGNDWPVDLDEIIYFDGFGNAVTGRRGMTLVETDFLSINGYKIKSAITFSTVDKNVPLWYTNSMGLVEIAVNQSNAQEQLSLKIGQLIKLIN